MSELEKDFMKYMQKLGAGQGLDSLTSAIIAITYLEPGDVAMEELARKTGYSLSSISLKAKLLENFGLVSRKRKPATKKIFLQMDKNFIKYLKDAFIKKEERGIALAKSEVPKIIEKYKSKPLSETEKAKLRIIENYYKQVLKFEQLFKQINKLITDFDKA